MVRGVAVCGHQCRGMTEDEVQCEQRLTPLYVLVHGAWCRRHISQRPDLDEGKDDDDADS